MIQKSVYWVCTALLALMYCGAGVFYLTDIAAVQQMWGHLGFPAYLVPIMAVVKIAAAVVVLWRPIVGLTDFAYAGMFFHLVLAVSAHVNAGDGGFLPASIGMVLLVLSFFTQNAARAKPSPYGRWPLAA
jgi:hypothetical protein